MTRERLLVLLRIAVWVLVGACEHPDFATARPERRFRAPGSIRRAPLILAVSLSLDLVEFG